MPAWFSPAHRGGAGSPMVLLHGFMDTHRTWELVLPALERHHDVLAPTLAGHAGGPPFDPRRGGIEQVADAVERAMDEAGFATAHLVGNSLGGFVALRLAARDRARTVVALAPAGGWDSRARPGFYPAITTLQLEIHDASRRSAHVADQLAATPAGRRRLTSTTTVAYEHLPADLLAHQVRAAAACDVPAMVETALREGYELDAERVTCPVRIVWGTRDALLPLPDAAVRYRRDWLPTAEFIELDDVGHAPQLDRPLETAQLVLDFATP